MSVRSYEEILKEIEEASKAQKEADISASNRIYDAQKQTVSDAYGTQIQEAKSAYQDQIDENAVQKLINERQIAENMANLGLTDSGLNRTQQTATQLSYANNNTRINLARQKAVDALAQAMTAKMTELDAGKLAAEEGIRSNYAQNARSQAVDIRNNEVENETARQKAAYEAEAKKYEASLKAQTEALQRNQSNFTTLLKDISNANLTDNQKIASISAYLGGREPDVTTIDLMEAFGYGLSNGQIIKLGENANGTRPDAIRITKIKNSKNHGNAKKIMGDGTVEIQLPNGSIRTITLDTLATYAGRDYAGSWNNREQGDVEYIDIETAKKYGLMW